MEKKEKIRQTVFQAIDEINQILSDDQKIKKSLTTEFIGESAQLDSLGLVNLIVAIEQKIEEEFGITIVLASDQAMSQKNSPFRTVATLIDYISLFLKDK